MVERNAGVALDKRIEFRIGIHFGDVIEENDGDLMGDGVNIAARLEGIAKPGAICLASLVPPQNVHPCASSRPTTFHWGGPSLVGEVRSRRCWRSDRRAPLEWLPDHNTRRATGASYLPQNGRSASAAFRNPHHGLDRLWSPTHARGSSAAAAGGVSRGQSPIACVMPR
jgi:hypothetical protein